MPEAKESNQPQPTAYCFHATVRSYPINHVDHGPWQNLLSGSWVEFNGNWVEFNGKSTWWHSGCMHDPSMSYSAVLCSCNMSFSFILMCVSVGRTRWCLFVSFVYRLGSVANKVREDGHLLIVRKFHIIFAYICQQLHTIHAYPHWLSSPKLLAFAFVHASTRPVDSISLSNNLVI